MSILYIPETPSYLVWAGREAEAAHALRWLRGPHADVHRELAGLRDNVLASRTCPPSPRHPLLQPALITCGLMFFQRSDTFLYYFMLDPSAYNDT